MIIASNHQAFCDSLFIPLVVPRKVTFVAKADYFKSWKTRWFFRAIGQIPMERGGGKASMQSLNEAVELLSAAERSGSTLRELVRPTIACTVAEPASPGWS